MPTRRGAGRSTPVGATLLALALALAAAVFATADTVSAPLAPTPADGAPAPSLLSPSSPVRVLAVPLVAARSHLFVMWAVVEELAVRGNEVAVRGERVEERGEGAKGHPPTANRHRRGPLNFLSPSHHP